MSTTIGEITTTHAERDRKPHNISNWGPCKICGHFLAKIQLETDAEQALEKVQAQEQAKYVQ